MNKKKQWILPIPETSKLYPGVNFVYFFSFYTTTQHLCPTFPTSFTLCSGQKYLPVFPECPKICYQKRDQGGVHVVISVLRKLYTDVNQHFTFSFLQEVPSLDICKALGSFKIELSPLQLWEPPDCRVGRGLFLDSWTFTIKSLPPHALVQPDHQPQYLLCCISSFVCIFVKK